MLRLCHKQRSTVPQLRRPWQICPLSSSPAPQTESVGRTDRGDIGTNTELHSEALSLGSTGPPDVDELASQTDKWSILNDEARCCWAL